MCDLICQQKLSEFFYLPAYVMPLESNYMFSKFILYLVTNHLKYIEIRGGEPNKSKLRFNLIDDLLNLHRKRIMG